MGFPLWRLPGAACGRSPHGFIAAPVSLFGVYRAWLAGEARMAYRRAYAAARAASASRCSFMNHRRTTQITPMKKSATPATSQ